MWAKVVSDYLYLAPIPRYGRPHFGKISLKKFPRPSLFTEGAPCLELKLGPSGPTTKKIGGPRTPHGGDMGGQSFNFPPFPLNFPSSDIGNLPPTSRAPPRYNPRDFGKYAGNAAGDIFTFELAPGQVRTSSNIARNCGFYEGAMFGAP